MLWADAKLSDVRVGDTIRASFTDGEETVTSLPVPIDDDSNFVTWETDKHHGTMALVTISPEMTPVQIMASSQPELAGRLAEALDRFAPAVRLKLFEHFCSRCGERPPCDCTQP